MDRRDHSTVTGLMIDDVDFQLSASCVGKSAVAAVLERRGTARRSRHIVTNIVAEPDAGGDVLVTYLLTVYGADIRGDGALPMAVPTVIADVACRVREIENRLLFVSMRSEKIFVSMDYPH